MLSLEVNIVGNISKRNIMGKDGFILGAGVSIEYGYPDGKELVDKIKATLLSAENFETGFNKSALGFILKRSRKIIHEFYENFNRTEIYTIDEYLENHPKYMKIGKLFLASILLDYEKSSLTYQHKDKENPQLYQYLFHKLFRTKDDLSNISDYHFITFNYDLSFEYYFYEYLIHNLDVSESESKKHVNELNIIHVYGKLGTLNIQDSRKGRKYGEKAGAEQIEKSANMIEVINENRSNLDFNKVFEALKEVDFLFILGFGFDNLNLKRLGIFNGNIEYKFCTRRLIYGSCYGKTPEEISRIYAKVFSKHSTPSALSDHFSVHKNVKFLRSNISFLQGFD